MALVVSMFLVQDAPGRPSVDAVVGTWRGSSVCVDRQAAPACVDEQVIYDIAPKAGVSGVVTLKADKVVDGRREEMGTLEFSADAKSDSWVTEFDTARGRALWRLDVNGKTMTGTMTLLPAKAVVRRITLRKDSKS